MHPQRAATQLPSTFGKPWWLSRTLWFNAVCAALAAAEAAFGLLQPLLPVSVYGLLAFALPVGNAVLRVLTSQGIATQGKDTL